ncbi:MAG: tRNA (N6-isopentenyl adenosine(37)-C2)-methylthiotransferase MiaB [Oscillospiraceae bacterium]|nr:tRNA (N6-isopentenyl adenosine(37)-C2)-methylthiotransferase MiaB [Oscillospiraceae bacterium]
MESSALKNLLGQLFSRPPRAFVRTYGCQGNLSDSERIKGILAAAGFDFCTCTEEADLIIMNTCAIREHAQERVFGNIGALKPLKEQRREMKIAVCGCMPQQGGVGEKIQRRFPFVDLVFGTHALPQLPQMLFEIYSGTKHLRRVEDEEGTISENLPIKRDSSFKAWLPISYGCDNFCSYCVVPYVRGRERSRAFDVVVKEARELAAQGYKDITLLGQNVNSYRDGNKNFPKLVKEIDSIEGDFRIRFMTSHPKDCSEELLRTMAQCRKAARHLHLPVQSGNDEILSAMNRKYTRSQYLETVNLAKSLMPDLTITSDIIVGFPGESEAQFRDTLDLVRQVEYGSLFTFIYSPRDGTAAAALPDPVSRQEKVARLQELCSLQESIALRRISRYQGKVLRVLAEEVREFLPDGQALISARMESNGVVEFAGDEGFVGQFLDVEITDTNRLILKGKFCECHGRKITGIEGVTA